MPDKIISKARSSSWAGQIIGLIFIIAILVVCIKSAVKENGTLDFRNGLLWLSAITILGLFVAFIRFIFIGRQELTVDKEGITVTYGISRKTWLIKYNEIEDFIVTRITDENTQYTNGGYYQLEILLYDGSSIVIDENEYDNYKELKALIYHYKQIEE